MTQFVVSRCRQKQGTRRIGQYCSTNCQRLQGDIRVIVGGGGKGEVAGGVAEVVFGGKSGGVGYGALEEGFGFGVVLEVNEGVGGVVEEGGVLRGTGYEGGI